MGVLPRSSPLRLMVAIVSVTLPSTASLIVVAQPPTAAGHVTVRRDEGDPYWVHGRVVVGTEPDAVWARLRQVDRWATLFHDIQRLRVLEHANSRWRVELGSTIMECGPHDYIVRLGEPRTVHLVIDAPGVDARGRMLVQPGPRPETAVVIYQLRVEATGIVSWFVSESRLRDVQQRLVSSYLHDIHDVFRPATKG